MAIFYKFQGDLMSLGQVLLQGKFCIWHCRKHADKTLRLRRTGKTQQRHLFLYTKAIIICKHRRQSPPYVQEYYEFKLELPVKIFWSRISYSNRVLYSFMFLF